MVSTVPGQAVVIQAGLEQPTLTIAGDLRSLAILAGDIASLGEAGDGGHQHVEYFDGHAYLGEGSASVTLISPHGGMPSESSAI